MLEQVNDLREEFAGDMLDSLRAVLSMYGVQIMNVRGNKTRVPYLPFPAGTTAVRGVFAGCCESFSKCFHSPAHVVRSRPHRFVRQSRLIPSVQQVPWDLSRVEKISTAVAHSLLP